MVLALALDIRREVPDGRGVHVAACPAFPVSEHCPMSFLIYLLGFALVTGGIAWGLSVAGVPTLYIAIACVILVGIGVLSGVSKTRMKDPPSH